MKSGTVFLVGAGPGAVDLLTVRAARLLAQADVVFYDALVPAEIIALAERAEKIAVGKRCGRHSTAQRFINKRLADAAASHRVVVRLKGGDPMLFGRAQEEMDFLRSRGIAVEVVPGVSAAFAAAADLQRSLTVRGVSRSVVLATPRAADGESRSAWAAAVAAGDTAALYMSARDAASVRDQLLSAGVSADLPVVLVENAGTESSRVHRGVLAGLEALAQELRGGPALILLGRVFHEAAAQAREPRIVSQSA